MPGREGAGPSGFLPLPSGQRPSDSSPGPDAFEPVMTVRTDVNKQKSDSYCLQSHLESQEEMNASVFPRTGKSFGLIFVMLIRN